MLVFSVTITKNYTIKRNTLYAYNKYVAYIPCSEGKSFVGIYTDGLFDGDLLLLSTWNFVKLLSL